MLELQMILNRLSELERRVQILESSQNFSPSYGQQQQMAYPTYQEQIIAVRKNENGNIIAVMTDQQRILQYDQALAEAKAGKLAHVDVFHKYGRDILRSEPDGIKENNLDNLPLF
ncbi:DUF3892 domain-containing protein [Ammoniphilus resinae]|uniref:DUF3892 domain-containing protein n=1 Tax=Ammoniphilus resinae TaxID=861532 RepID=A0ABS4GLA0_9BACL|nr:DUF3892 domain-containing protein [Ammoniphilus resinae]MBP1931046.1 hypothetical protein [Ammoniphilus resinae]